jgi:hypothetical protein
MYIHPRLIYEMYDLSAVLIFVPIFSPFSIVILGMPHLEFTIYRCRIFSLFGDVDDASQLEEAESHREADQLTLIPLLQSARDGTLRIVSLEAHDIFSVSCNRTYIQV